jgi:hypothetical protein
MVDELTLISKSLKFLVKMQQCCLPKVINYIYFCADVVELQFAGFGKVTVRIEI